MQQQCNILLGANLDFSGNKREVFVITDEVDTHFSFGWNPFLPRHLFLYFVVYQKVRNVLLMILLPAVTSRQPPYSDKGLFKTSLISGLSLAFHFLFPGKQFVQTQGPEI